MGFEPTEKMILGGRIEKHVLRKAFDTSEEPDEVPYLPHEILWRQKEQFSDGVGYGWIDALKVFEFHTLALRLYRTARLIECDQDTASSVVSDKEFAARSQRWPEDTPDTKEA